MHIALRSAVAGLCAGVITGLFGAGGGMILIPLLTTLIDAEDSEIFPTSLSIILPICIISLLFSLAQKSCSLYGALPYLIGSGIGGYLSGKYGKNIPSKWLHRGLGILILWGGIRYLC